MSNINDHVENGVESNQTNDNDSAVDEVERSMMMQLGNVEGNESIEERTGDNDILYCIQRRTYKHVII